MIKILGIKISTLPYNKSLKFIVDNINENKQLFVSTPNPEILLEARKNEKFKKILNESTNLNTADGIGLIYASKYLKIRGKIDKKIPERVSGSDLMMSICMEERLKTKKIFLLGASEEVSKKTKEILKEKIPGIQVCGRYSGKSDESDDIKSVKLINDSGANILFVAFGAPKQEFWIERNKKNLPNIKLFIGIGGSFDFISGEKKRAPKLMQKMGLEWLYRLYIEPKRIKRILKAVIIFPSIVLKEDLF
ncbi:MAG: WecB/TagA/CpsF family glycosyltransferase [Candidatus Gracilibacteria bacterium]|jgi:N-acetylglucosaminyldiphosphoundecaprenol N-acetyl-beta-D-mannosaminyltransferase|nr:WecB/TagA/CpsF family glycosyltransferase [Candidatus Gracilibacteria bacterium]